MAKCKNENEMHIIKPLREKEKDDYGWKKGHKSC
jgi:hypothetical protein